MFVVSLTYISPLEEIDPLLAPHIAWLKQGFAEGLFLASGRKVPRTGGIILARGDRTVLEQRLTEDPFAKAGVARYEIIEFVATTTAPELDAVRETFSS